MTPVASAAIATGCGPGEHHIPSMNWYHRGEERYVEYGSSFQATRAFGVVRSLYDTVYNMNMAHLTRAHRTVFEHLDDAGLRTACTTWLIYRGRTRHDPSGTSVYRRIAEAAQFRHPVYGRRRALLRRPIRLAQHRLHVGARDARAARPAHAAAWAPTWSSTTCSTSCSSRYPTTTPTPTRPGPDGQVRSIAEADRALDRIVQVAGGVEAFLEEHAVIVMSDHSQTTVEAPINLADAFADARVLGPSDPAPTEAELAVSPAARSAMVYALDESRRERAGGGRRRDAARGRGSGPGRRARGGRGGRPTAARGELRFAPGGDLRRPRGRTWRVEGRSAPRWTWTAATYPDALNRLWSALECPHSGDVLASAAPGYEFVDWGGADHVGGGSHGSLHRDDSEGVLLLCGVDAPEREQWSLTDVSGLVLAHFGVPLTR